MIRFALYVILASWRDPFPIKVAEFSDRPGCVERGKEMEGTRYNGALVEQWECIAIYEEKDWKEEVDER